MHTATIQSTRGDTVRMTSTKTSSTPDGVLPEIYSTNLVFHRLGEPDIHWRQLLPRHPNAHVVVITCRDVSGAAGEVSVTTACEAALCALARGVADAGAVPVVLLRVC